MTRCSSTSESPSAERRAERSESEVRVPACPHLFPSCRYVQSGEDAFERSTACLTARLRHNSERKGDEGYRPDTADTSSGHGTQVKVDNKAEADGLGEAICPLDFKQAGMIVDMDSGCVLQNGANGSVS